MIIKASLKIPNGYIEEQTTQWTNEKVQKIVWHIVQLTSICLYHILQNACHTLYHNDIGQTCLPPLITGGGLMCSGRVSSSCYTGGTRRVTSFGLK
jgi:hypothetical protein